MIKNNEYTIINQKIKKETKIALLSDIHFSKQLNQKYQTQILENLQKNHPDIICVCGDIMDSNNEVKSQNSQEELKQFLTKISQISPIVMVYGNHDEVKRTGRKEKKGSKKYLKEIVKEIPHCTLLDNEKATIKSINFYGIYLPYSYYYNKKHREDTTILKKYYQELQISPSKHYQILLCHTPLLLHQLKHSNIDLILSGHTHNGLMPTWLENKIQNTRGLLSPNLRLFPNYTRGKTKYKHTIHIISGGIIKLSRISTPLSFINFLFRPHIEYITLKKS